MEVTDYRPWNSTRYHATDVIAWAALQCPLCSSSRGFEPRTAHDASFQCSTQLFCSWGSSDVPAVCVGVPQHQRKRRPCCFFKQIQREMNSVLAHIFSFVQSSVKTKRAFASRNCLSLQQVTDFWLPHKVFSLSLDSHLYSCLLIQFISSIEN